MKVDKSVKIPLPYGIMVGQLVKFLDNVPDGAVIRVHTTQGDRPWESETHSMEIEWTEEI